MTGPTWTSWLIGQLTFYWEAHLWPRLTGLTDAEYLWEPTPGAWSVRPDVDGQWRLSETGPAGVPTIAWRIAHLGAHCLGNRAAAFFGPDRADGTDMFDTRYAPTGLPGTAAGGLALLTDAYQRWCAGVTALDDAALAAPLGPMGGPYAEEPMANLVLHISREVMHHGGEICLLRDLYAARPLAP